MRSDIRIGKLALSLVLSEDGEIELLKAKTKDLGYKVCTGRVGSMEMEKIFAAIETAVQRESIIDSNYHSVHSIYHAVLEAVQGLGRGMIALRNIHRTAGLKFAVVRGYKETGNVSEGEWVAVALYGTIGAPVKGQEHEAVGLGINHI